MAEQFTLAHTVGVHFLCEEEGCGQPMLRDGDFVLTTAPVQYPHRCSNGHVRNLPRSYPGTDFVITTEPVEVNPVEGAPIRRRKGLARWLRRA